jgi:glyoxylase-like metal-dependent hydrolase (beta-lactamase superfamily II)
MKVLATLGIFTLPFVSASCAVGEKGTAIPVAPSIAVSITRLECGTMIQKRPDLPAHPVYRNGCYLIRHGPTVMLWDAGLTERLVGSSFEDDAGKFLLDEALPPQLARLGLKPADVAIVGISHRHGDHIGQTHLFPDARLLIGRADFDGIKHETNRFADMSHWVEGKGKLDLVDGDRDVFGDGTVTILATPGHTEGHQSLLVRTQGGAVLLSGDAVHFRDQLESGVPPGNGVNLVQAKASLQRFLDVAKKERARIVVQHDPSDVDALPKAD